MFKRAEPKTGRRLGEMISRVTASFILRSCIFTAFAVAVSAQTVTKRPASAQDPAALIHQGDVIEVDVVGSLDFDWRGTLTPEGYLKDLDKTTEQIFARCRSTDEVAKAVVAAYSRVLRDPVVRVRIIDTSDRATAFIDGAIRTPTRFRLKRAVQLSELIALAGGFTEDLSGEITIFRPVDTSCTAATGGKDETLHIKLDDLLTGDPASNPRILTGDIITVNEATPIYVIGGVKDPGRIFARGDITLLRAIASRGGLAKNADAGSATVYRRENGKVSVISVDLDKIRDGSPEDIPLKAFDIIDVPAKGSEKRSSPPVIEPFDGTASSKVQLRIVE